MKAPFDFKQYNDILRRLYGPPQVKATASCTCYIKKPCRTCQKHDSQIRAALSICEKRRGRQ